MDVEVKGSPYFVQYECENDGVTGPFAGQTPCPVSQAGTRAFVVLNAGQNVRTQDPPYLHTCPVCGVQYNLPDRYPTMRMRLSNERVPISNVKGSAGIGG